MTFNNQINNLKQNKMKSTILTLALMATFAFSHSQNAYETSMNKGLEMLHVSDNYETAYNCSNYFERIADANKKEWLPLYYAAYTSMASGFYETDADKKDALYQRGLTYIEKANAIQGDEKIGRAHV